MNSRESQLVDFLGGKGKKVLFSKVSITEGDIKKIEVKRIKTTVHSSVEVGSPIELTFFGEASENFFSIVIKENFQISEQSKCILVSNSDHSEIYIFAETDNQKGIENERNLLQKTFV